MKHVKLLFTITLSCVALLLISCQQEEEHMPVSDKGYIQLRLSADDALRTRAMQDVADVSSWYAIVSDETETLYDKQIGSELESIPFEPGTYSISVRNYDNMDAANATNDGWGDAYHTGTASDIEVSAGGTAYVHIDCGRALNAKFRLDYSQFSGIINTLTITEPKPLIFAYADGTLAREAFFLPRTTLTYTIEYTLAGTTKTTEPQTLTLGEAATVSILSIKSNINGGITVSLTCDDEFEGEAEAEIVIDGVTGDTQQ